MAERQPPNYMDVSNAYSGDELGTPWRDVIGEGIIEAGDLLVTPGAANTVDVAAGAAYVLGDTNPALQPNYRVYNDAVVNLGITPDPAQARRVLIHAQIVDQAFAGVGRAWSLQALLGTPAASPALPATPASSLALANILVPAAAANSAAYTITDLRARAAVGGGRAALASAAGTWTSYTPTWGSTGTAPVLGNGTIIGRYTQTGKTVHGYGQLTVGSTTTPGTGVWVFGLPVPANGMGSIGIVTMQDTSAGQIYNGFLRLASPSVASVDNLASPEVGWSTGAPIVLATGDILGFRFTYDAS